MADRYLCQDVKQSLGALFVCSEQGDAVRIRTPFLYPDGDVIDLYCHAQGSIVNVTDLGETTRWLRMQTPSQKRSTKQTALIEDTCMNHGVEFYRGMLQARTTAGDDLAATLLRVAQAALRVADIWFTFRARSVESVNDEVAEYLTAKEFSYERGKRLVGRSGKVWTVDFHVRGTKASSLVCVLGTGSRSAARAVVEHVVATWYDISHLVVGPEALRCISLFDDTADVWNPEDFRLVENLSSVARWSKPEEFLDILAA